MGPPVILLVDDEADLLLLLSAAITRRLPEYEVRAASNAAEAEQQLADLTSDGRRVVAAVVDHQIPPTADTPTGLAVLANTILRWPKMHGFLFTGHASGAVEVEATRQGVAVLWKPLRLSEVLGHVVEALNADQAGATS